jgi:hypothetical protein
MKRTLIFGMIVIAAVLLSPWLLWNFIRYIRDGLDVHP